MRWMLIVLIVFMAGCASEVPSWKIHQSIEVCEEYGGLDKMDFFVRTFAYCNDGTIHVLARPVKRED